MCQEDGQGGVPRRKDIAGLSVSLVPVTTGGQTTLAPLFPVDTGVFLFLNTATDK